VSEPEASLGTIEDAWYVAALGSQLDRTLRSRRILGRSVLLYRDSSGQAVALSNRCSHRGFPLTEGVLDGDLISCGYHGFTFDTCGTCVSVPGQSAIPSRANVAAYPTREVGPFVWVWLGDPNQAIERDIPCEAGLEDRRFRFVTGIVPIACAVLLLIDNLMDLSHESFIHATKIGTPEVAEAPITTEVDEGQHLVKVRRYMEGVACPPSYQRFTGLSSPIDRTQEIHYFAPGLYVLNTRVAGSVEVDGSPSRRVFSGKVVYGLTPEDDHHTHYFFAIGRDYGLDDSVLDEAMLADQHALIEEDAAAVVLLDQLGQLEGPSPEVSIKIDAGGLAARRMMAQFGGVVDSGQPRRGLRQGSAMRKSAS